MDISKLVEDGARDTWWLVERRSCQLWATGRGSFHGLTSDATRAERFASKFEAEEEIRCAEDCFRNELVATEHKFIAAETHSAALARALEEARDELLECKADYHRNPSSVIDKCNAVLAEARSLLAPKEDTANG